MSTLFSWHLLSLYACLCIGDATDFTLGVFLRLPSKSFEALRKRALEVVDPASTAYGSYLSQEQLAASTGIDGETCNRTSEWLLKALGSARTTTRVVRHGDAVLGTLTDFSSTYLLGAALVGASVDGVAVPSLPDVPEEVELIVTPSLPDRFCKSLSQSVCSAKPPCRWRRDKRSHRNSSRASTQHNESASAGDSSMHCVGDFEGWVCWRNGSELKGSVAQWKCFEPKTLLGMTMTGEPFEPSEKYRRRRRGLKVESLLREGRSNKLNKLGFSVLPRSESLLLVLSKQGNGTQPWDDVEISLRQDGIFHNRVLKRSDFGLHGSLTGAIISGLKNLRPVDRISVCVSGKEALSGVQFASSMNSVDSRAGCKCDSSTGKDLRLGRSCEELYGLSPQHAPVDLVLPRVPQTLSNLRQDLGFRSSAHALGIGASIALVEFLHETFSQGDIERLRDGYGLPKSRSNVTVVGHFDPKESVNVGTSGEGSLDVQVASILSPSAPMTWWGVSPFYLDGFMLAYATQVNDANEPPLVHSISWGEAESLFPPVYVQRLDYELMKLALRGITVIIASGDNGISAANRDCAFVPCVMGASPWVTSVGATMPSLSSAPYCNTPLGQGLGSCTEPGPITCSTAAGAAITSSGYWSIYRSQPEYQSNPVERYLSSADCKPCQTTSVASKKDALPSTPCQHLSSDRKCALQPLLGKTRASPDIALPGNSYPVFVNGSVSLFDGTSASAPAFAAMVSLLNAEQARRGLPPLGLLNPWLYKTYEDHPEAFIDIVVGDIGSTEGQACPLGFRAGPGWDPATGLGVPQMDALLRLLPRRQAMEEQLSDVDGVARLEGSFVQSAFVAAASAGAGAIFMFVVMWSATRRRNSLRLLCAGQVVLSRPLTGDEVLCVAPDLDDAVSYRALQS